MAALASRFSPSLKVSAKKMGSGVQPAMEEQPSEKLDFGGKFSSPNPGRIRGRIRTKESQIRPS